MTRLPARILDKISPCPNTGCWFWCAAWDSGNGYGKVSWKGRAWMAHRLVYALLVGPIPWRMVLDHKCRVRACCNPDHMEPVTGKTNTYRGDAVLYEVA